ncbi:hypothetical protein [Nonomuraea sp. B19D2]|uniref:hypothetical protein n=1 Tax=Nonomuraea sp. B19D2 TaxID=3159561 RepID=UPI0032D9D987
MTPTPDGHNGDEEIPARRLEVVAVIVGVIFIGIVLYSLQPWASGEPDPSPSAAAVASASPSQVPTESLPPSPTAPASQQQPQSSTSTSTSTAASAPPSPSPSVSPSPSPSSSRPVVRWRGTITVNGLYDHTDLDKVPPRIARDEPDADIVGDWLKTSIKAAAPGVRVALLPSGTKPGMRACRDAAAAGSDQIEQVQAGDVLCAVTSQGRTAQLRVTYATQLSSRPTVRLAVTVWDPPAS